MRGLSGILKPSKTGVDKHENVQKGRKEERYEEKSNECSFGSSDGCGYGR